MKKALICIAALSILLTGCTGPFELTKKLHDWQTNVDENQWVEEGVFLGCVILQAYTVTTIVDGLVLNSIEFWTGENPMDKAAAPQGDEMCLRTVAEQM